MDIEHITIIVTIVVSFILGEITKRSTKVSNSKVIPLQNLIVGLVIAGIEWIITKDFNAAVALSGLLTGGVYDLGVNLKLLFDNKKEETK